MLNNDIDNALETFKEHLESFALTDFVHMDPESALVSIFIQLILLPLDVSSC